MAGTIPTTMKALTFKDINTIAYEEVPAPKLIHPRDAIVKVLLCSVCGSDLHPFHGRERGIAKGTVVGHEMVGIVVAVGSGVNNVCIGDRVGSPFTCNCGACFYCDKGVTCRCEHQQARLFGWINEEELQVPEPQRLGLHGSQAQYVRVPLADSTLVKLPDNISNELGILLGDILSTAYFCAENGQVGPDTSVVVVVGCGPVGLLACMVAKMRGATQVWAVDAVPERLRMAESFGAQPLNIAAPPSAAATATPTAADSSDVTSTSTSSSSSGGPAGVVQAVRAATGGRGADVVLEVVGSSDALRLAFDLVRPCGVLSSVGVHTESSFPFSPVEGYNKNVTYRSGRCPARSYMAKLMPVVTTPDAPDFTRIITHRRPLSEGVDAYAMFAQRRDGCVKCVLDPWA